MLPKRQRLTRREFETLLKKGRRIHGATLSLVVLPATCTKCGVVVSKKTARKAVARNLLRRRVYHVLSTTLDDMQKKHVAVLTRPQAAQLSYDALNEEITSLTHKI